MIPRFCLIAIGLALLASVRVTAAQSRIWREDERIVITSFNEVSALAFDGRRVFAATTGGLQAYDAIARRWLAPSTIEDGYPLFERPTAIAYDRSEGGVWLATAAGNLYLWSELSGRWDSRVPGSTPVDLLRPSRNPDDDVAWRVLRGVVTLDPHGRRWPLSALIPADRPGTYWVGTAGGNILLADSRSLSAEWLGFGTLARGVSALAIDAKGGIWLGGNGLGPRDGLSYTDSTLQNWTSYEAYSARAPRRAVTRILTGADTWAGAQDGLYVLTAGARAWRRLEDRDGLPASYVRSLARTTAGVWVGTQQGLALVDAELRIVWRGMDGVRINGLAEAHDTVWIASDAGIWLGVADDAGVRVVAAPHAQGNPRLGRVFAVARAGRYLAALATDGLYLYDGNWSDRLRVALPPGSRAFDLRGDEHSLFILGTHGLTEWQVDSDRWQHLSIPADIPEGPVTDAARSGEFLWVATPIGAMRLHWH